MSRSSLDFYSPGQLKVIFPYLSKVTPQWLVLGGPADANEADTAIAKWPGIKVVGVEANEEAFQWQQEHSWPGAYLFNLALADRIGTMEMVNETGKIRNASLDPYAVEGNRGNESVIFSHVQTTTLDLLDQSIGPFENAVVWLDIEGFEYNALKGAINLIESGRVLLWNLEMLSRVPGLMEGIPRLLHNYKAVKDWNDSESCRDRIFVRKDLL